MENSFDPDLVRAIFKNVWSRKILERDRNEDIEILDVEEHSRLRISREDLLLGVETTTWQAGAGTSKKHRPTTANSNALKLSCELLQLFIRETVQRAAIIAEAEGIGKIEATHLERILPQLLVDF